MRCKFETVRILLLLIVVPCTVARGLTDSWTGGSGKWETAGNWSLGAMPAISQGAVLITNAAMKTVTIDSTTAGSFPGAMTISNLLLSAPSGSINTQALTSAGLVTPLRILNTLTIGSGGVLRITNSILQVDGLMDGVFTNDGTVALLNGGSIITTNTVAYVGAISLGQLTVPSGTWLGQTVVVGQDDGSQGTLTVDGGSISMDPDMVVANNAGSRGTVTVNSGTVQVQGSMTLGFDLGATGRVFVTGGTLTVTNGIIDLADFDAGFGELNVSNGAVLAQIMLVGNVAGGLGRFNLTGGKTMVSAGLANVVVGNCAAGASGIVNVSGGALYVTNATHTAYIDVRNGTLTISGSGAVVVDKVVMTNTCGHLVRLGGTLSYISLNLGPALDADGDGLSNANEQSRGTDPFATDTDGDGKTDLQEVLSGSDPTNSASAFRITSAVRTNNDLRITWMTAPGKTNALQRGTGGPGGSYSTNNFTTIFTVTNTLGTTTNYLDLGAATNGPARYYRVRLVP